MSAPDSGHSKCKGPEAGAMWLCVGEEKGGHSDWSKMNKENIVLEEVGQVNRSQI